MDNASIINLAAALLRDSGFLSVAGRLEADGVISKADLSLVKDLFGDRLFHATKSDESLYGSKVL